MTWTTLTLQVTTPLFNGGADAGAGQPAVDADAAEGVRVASIRGAMRFWFRALAGALTGPDLRLLGALERRVFGGAGSGADGASSSPVLLRIPRRPSLVKPAGPHSFVPKRRHGAAYKDHPNRWILYLMGQGLANLATFEILRPYVPPGQEFEVKLGFRHARECCAADRAAIEGLAMASLWLACTYGGIGARARRGFGGVRIIDAAGPGSDGELLLPEPWHDLAALVTPDLDYYTGKTRIWPDGPVAACVRHLKTLAADAPLSTTAWAEGVPPSFPVMSKKYAKAATSGGGVFADWAEVLAHAGENWRHFRAAEENTGPHGRSYFPPIESPEWIKTVTSDGELFPLGALGLPIGFGGKEGYQVNADGVSPGDPPRRRASPLWMRVVGEDGEYRLFSYAFQSRFLPVGVTLSGKGRRPKPVLVTDADVKRQTDQWIKVMNADGTFITSKEGATRRLTGDL
jgi:CRISPR-associated protein Cmr1